MTELGTYRTHVATTYMSLGSGVNKSGERSHVINSFAPMRPNISGQDRSFYGTPGLNAFCCDNPRMKYSVASHCCGVEGGG